MKPKMLANTAADFLQVSVQAIHKNIKSKQLPYEKNKNRIFFGYETSKTLFNIKVNPLTISSQIVKGGTGKTTLISSLAIGLSLYGLKVLCIDLDQQANLTKFFGVDSVTKPIMIDILEDDASLRESIVPAIEGIDILPSRIENAMLDNVLMLKQFALDRVYRDRINEIKGDYDFILIDCPPSLGQSVTAAALSSDFVIMPVNPERFAADGLKIAFDELKNIEKKYKLKINRKIILNKFDIRTTLSHMALADLIKNEDYGPHLFSTYIRLSQEFPNSAAKGVSIFDPITSSSAKEDIDIWCREIISMCTAINS